MKVTNHTIDVEHVLHIEDGPIFESRMHDNIRYRLETVKCSTTLYSDGTIGHTYTYVSGRRVYKNGGTTGAEFPIYNSEAEALGEQLIVEHVLGLHTNMRDAILGLAALRDE